MSKARGLGWTICLYRFGIGANATKGLVRLSPTASHTGLHVRERSREEEETIDNRISAHGEDR